MERKNQVDENLKNVLKSLERQTKKERKYCLQVGGVMIVTAGAMAVLTMVNAPEVITAIPSAVIGTAGGAYAINRAVCADRAVNTYNRIVTINKDLLAAHSLNGSVERDEFKKKYPNLSRKLPTIRKTEVKNIYKF